MTSTNLFLPPLRTIVTVIAEASVYLVFETMLSALNVVYYETYKIGTVFIVGETKYREKKRLTISLIYA